MQEHTAGLGVLDVTWVTTETSCQMWGADNSQNCTWVLVCLMLKTFYIQGVFPSDVVVLYKFEGGGLPQWCGCCINSRGGSLPQWCSGVVVTIWFEFLFLTQLFFSKHSFFNSWFYIENSRLTQTTLVLNPSPRPHLAISLSTRADNWSLESNWLSSDLVEGNISDTFRNKQKLNLAIKTLSRVSKGKNWGYEDKLLVEVS